MNFDEMNKYNKDAMETMVKSYAVATKTLHSIADEVADFSKKSFEANMAHVEQLMSAKNAEAAVEMQTAYAQSSMEGLISKVSRIGEMVTNLTKESYSSYGGTAAKTVNIVKTTVEKAAKPAAA